MITWCKYNLDSFLDNSINHNKFTILEIFGTIHRVIDSCSFAWHEENWHISTLLWVKKIKTKDAIVDNPDKLQ
jgi:hypothetical protein